LIWGRGRHRLPQPYGTGIRNLASLSAVTASINYRFSAVVTYAGGRKSTYAGLDQLN